MNMQRTIFASAGIVLLLASASFAEQVKTDYAHGTDFSRYKTYSWEKVQTQDPLWVSRIKDAVNASMYSGCRFVRREQQEPRLARVVERHPFKQVREKHQESRQGCTEDVRALSSRR